MIELQIQTKSNPFDFNQSSKFDNMLISYRSIDMIELQIQTKEFNNKIKRLVSVFKKSDFEI